MRKKSFVSKHLNGRFLRYHVFNALRSVLPFLRCKLNFYTQHIYVKNLAHQVLADDCKDIKLSALGIDFTKQQQDYFAKAGEQYSNQFTQQQSCFVINNVTLLGHSGCVIDNASYKAVTLNKNQTTVQWNQAKPKKLQNIISPHVNTMHINMLGQRAGHKHFYHFFADLFINLWFYLSNIYQGNKLIIVLRNDLNQIQKDLYSALQQQYPQIEYLYLDNNQKLQCNNLTIPCYRSVANKKRAFIGKDYAKFLNNIFCKFYKIKATKPHRKIYVSRQDAKFRKITNEDEIIKTAKANGYEIAITGAMNFKQQIELFKSATHIVTTHGAALVNLLFCQDKVNVLEIAPKDYMESTYMWYGKLYNANYQHMICEAGGSNQNFYCNPEEFEKLI